MSDNPLQKQVFENLNLKETDELLQIWQDNKRYEWSDMAFEVIKQILQERGVEIPAQDEPEFEEETEQSGEKTELKTQTASDGMPTFYKPQEVLFFVSATSMAAWAVLAVYIIYGMWYFFSGWGNYVDPRVLTGGIMSFLGRILTGVVSFVFLKGVSYALGVLMEFEFNSRSKNSNKLSP